MAPEDYSRVISVMRKRKKRVKDYKIVMMPADTAEEEAAAIVHLMNEYKGKRKVEYLLSIKHTIRRSVTPKSCWKSGGLPGLWLFNAPAAIADMKRPAANTSLAILPLLFIGLSFGAKAENTSIVESCTAAGTFIDRGHGSLDDVKSEAFCRGLVTGVLAAGSWDACLPTGGISPNQAMGIFVKYLRDNPQRLHENGGLLLQASLVQAFPCK